MPVVTVDKSMLSKDTGNVGAASNVVSIPRGSYLAHVFQRGIER